MKPASPACFVSILLCAVDASKLSLIFMGIFAHLMALLTPLILIAVADSEASYSGITDCCSMSESDVIDF